jgi:isopenicillin N synthase-like dioxygenase
MYARDLPIIDFSPFRGKSPARTELIKKMGEAGRETGFFYLKNFGIDPARIAEAFAQSRVFFALPSVSKRELLWDKITNRGYDGLEAQSFKVGQPGDLKESFRFTVEPDAHNQVDLEAAWSFLVNQPNKWPKNMPQFRNVLLPFLHDCGDLVEDILSAFEEALDMPEPLLTGNHVRRNYTMRLLHYPAVHGPVKEGQARCGEHTDWTTITLLFQGGQGGLEVRCRNGEWILAPPLTDCVLVNIGDQLQAWTAGRLVSTPHRVSANLSPDSAIDRYSIALFCYADFDAAIDLGDAHTSGAYILSKLRETQSAGSAARDVGTGVRSQAAGERVVQ